MINNYDNESIKTNVAVMRSKLETVQQDVRDIKKTLGSDYVTLTEFEPIKKLVYGLVAVILTAVVTAIVALVLK